MHFNGSRSSETLRMTRFQDLGMMSRKKWLTSLSQDADVGAVDVKKPMLGKRRSGLGMLTGDMVIADETRLFAVGQFSG